MLILLKTHIPPARNAAKKTRSINKEIQGRGWSRAAARRNRLE
jgi:hypothetical protein